MFALALIGFLVGSYAIASFASYLAHMYEKDCND